MRTTAIAIVFCGLLLGISTVSRTAEILTDEDIRAGRMPKIGDVLMLTDFAHCHPRSAIRQESVKGKWWMRSYRTESGATGEMPCVEERDMDDPASCMAPELNYELNLEGVYDIWVGTYRGIAYGGIDIKLSSDPVYQPIMPYDDGIFLFNQVSFTPLRNIGYPALIRREIATHAPFGRRKGEKVEWLE